MFWDPSPSVWKVVEGKIVGSSSLIFIGFGLGFWGWESSLGGCLRTVACAEISYQVCTNLKV